MPAPGFEWFVAWRHLREDPERRSYRTAIVGLVLLVVGAGWVALAHFGPMGLHRLARMSALLSAVLNPVGALLPYMDTAGIVAIAVGLLLAVLGTLLANFTVFTAISIFGVFLGTGAPIVALSVMSGFETDLKSKIRATKADVVISTTEDMPFTDWRAVEGKIASVTGVAAAMAYVESEVIIKHSSNPAGMGIILRGIDAPRAARVLNLERTLREGKVDYLLHPEKIPDEDAGLMGFGAPAGAGAGMDDGEKEPPSEGGRARAGRLAEREKTPVVPGILLGDELYGRTLHVFVGSDVYVACPMCGVGPTGPMPKLKPFRVAGHFYTGMYEFDSKLAYVSLPEAQKFLGLGDEVTGIEVRTVNADRAREVADAIAARIGPGYEVRSWEELNRGLFMALKLEKIAMFVVLTFIALVASFSIVSNLIMLVTEKGR